MSFKIQKVGFEKNAGYQPESSKEEERKFKRYLLEEERKMLIKNAEKAEPTQQVKPATISTQAIGETFAKCCANNNYPKGKTK
jgi:hypothetical protein